MDNSKHKWNIGRQQEKAIKEKLEDAKANGRTDEVEGLTADLRRKQAEQRRLLEDRD